jgi:hypothetical protein
VGTVVAVFFLALALAKAKHTLFVFVAIAGGTATGKEDGRTTTASATDQHRRDACIALE